MPPTPSGPPLCSLAPDAGLRAWDDGPASGVTATAATLNGVVNPGGTDTTYTFEYGTTPAYGSSTTVTDAGSGDAAELVQAAVGRPGPRHHIAARG
jgi:hypothetical protein